MLHTEQGVSTLGALVGVPLLVAAYVAAAAVMFSSFTRPVVATGAPAVRPALTCTAHGPVQQHRC